MRAALEPRLWSLRFHDLRHTSGGLCLEGVELFEQVGVAVQAVDAGPPGDAADRDLVAGGGGVG